MSLYTNLISHYTLDETVSATAVDVHGSNTLAQSGGVGSATGKIGNGRSFAAASSQYFWAPSAAWNQTGDIDFTFGLWIKLESKTGANQRLLSKRGGAGAREYALLYLDTNERFQWIVSSDGTATTGILSAAGFGAIVPGVWYYVLVWHDAANDQIGIAVNGVENTRSHEGGVYVGTANFMLGNSDEGLGAFFDGVLDELSFWKGGLPTAGEQVALVNGGNGRPYSAFGLAVPRILQAHGAFVGQGGLA